MKKNLSAVFKNAAAFGIVVGLWVLFALMMADLITVLDGLTAVAFVTVISLLASDAMDKAFSDTGLLTWQYLVLAVLILMADGLWLFWASCSTWLQFVLRGLLMLAAVAAAFCWYWFFYRMSVLSDEERIVRTLTKAYQKAAKAFPALDDEGVRNALKETLFCRIEGNSLEGALLTDKPFVPGYGTYNSIAASGSLPAAEKSAALTNINAYINTLISTRKKDTAST